MNENENWEANLDWSKFDPLGGMPFYLLVRDGCMAALEKVIASLVKSRDAQNKKIEQWEQISRGAVRLNEDFIKFREAVGSSPLIGNIDTAVAADCPDGTLTISKWLEFGQSITRAFRNGTLVPDTIRSEIAKAERELSAAQMLYNFLKLYLQVAKRDFMLRSAPDKYKTRQFRLFVSEVKSLVDAGNLLSVGTENAPATLFKKEIEDIKRVSLNTLKTCRMVKREVERKGAAFWTGFADWQKATGC